MNARAPSLPRPNFTAARAFATAELIRYHLPRSHRQGLDAATDLARRHPLIDVLDAYCDGIERIIALPIDDRAHEIAKLLDDMDHAARGWPRSSP